MTTQPMQEFTIHVAKKDDKKKYSITRFNGNLNVDMSTWTGKELRLKREDNRSNVATTVAEQDYGAGSEYGRAAREEARRKKYGRQARSYNLDRQPWLLNIKDPADPKAKERKYKSIVDQTGEHADYWIFVKQGKRFTAHKVNSWYQFLPQVQHKILDIEQAEEQFMMRGKVMNQFALKAQIQQQAKDSDEDGGNPVKTSNLIIKDKDIMSSDDEDAGSDDDAETRRKKILKKKQNERPVKDKKVRVQNPDDVAPYESDDGDDEGREYDYMTDSGSDSDRETKTNEEKIDEAMVAVGDETGLKRDIDSNNESSDEEENDDDDEKDDAKREGNNAGNDGNNGGGSDESGDEDPDSATITSPLLLLQQKKASEDRKRPAGTESDDSTVPKKTKMEKASSSSALPSSMPPHESIPHSASSTTMSERQQDVHLREQIKRLLMRRPHTTKELLDLIRPQFEQVQKSVLVNKLANVIRELSAKQFRRRVGKKDVLHFTIEP